jgi:transposase
MNTPAPIKYKRYDEEFKRSAVEHLLVSGKSVRVIAHELGVNEQSLQKWKQRFKALPAGQVANTLEAVQAENRRLQRELSRAVQQRDILKKTLGIISAPPDNGLLG